MPCRCDHMEPTEREKESQIVAKHVVHLHRVLKSACPPDMSIASGTMYGDPTKADEFTAYLCNMMKAHSQVIIDRLPDGHIEDLELALWWRRHMIADDKRKEKEQQQALADRQKDLAKLDELAMKYPNHAIEVAKKRIKH